jgi:hypothetical protein
MLSIHIDCRSLDRYCVSNTDNSIAMSTDHCVLNIIFLLCREGNDEQRQAPERNDVFFGKADPAGTVLVASITGGRAHHVGKSELLE